MVTRILVVRSWAEHRALRQRKRRGPRSSIQDEFFDPGTHPCCSLDKFEHSNLLQLDGLIPMVTACLSSLPMIEHIRAT